MIPLGADRAISRVRHRGLEPGDVRRLVIFGVTILVVVPVCAWVLGGFGNWSDASWQPGLDIAMFATAPVTTRIHVVLVLALVASGWGILALRKGDRRHKTLGWTWVSAMVAMGVMSMTVPHGHNWVAAYVGGASAYPLLAYGIYAIRKKRDRRRHGRTMAMLMIALVLMTLLAMVPGRLLHDVLFGG